jgi:hypothetical protein
MYLLGFDLLRVARYVSLYMEGYFDKERVGVIGKRLLLFCKLSNSIYLDGGFLCSQTSTCAPFFFHFLCIIYLTE